MQLVLRDNLLFVSVRLIHTGNTLTIPDVIVDTGSATTMLSADQVKVLHIIPEPHDVLYTIRGVGGSEVVFSRKIEHFQIGPRVVKDFEVEIGGMDYGFNLNGILGMDFLLRSGAVIDLHRLELVFANML